MEQSDSDLNSKNYNNTGSTTVINLASSTLYYFNIWAYDQNLFPELYGYLPAFKRVRRFPTNQRFEPLNPGSELYLSDAWAAGDPFLTWGNYKIVSRVISPDPSKRRLVDPFVAPRVYK